MRNKRRWTAAMIALLWLSGAASAGGPTPDQAIGEAIANPFADHENRDDIVSEGRSLFNVHCSHCHGPNAFQGERPRDLRRLTLRYGDDTPAVFYQTAITGREDKGMPPWRGILEDEVLWKIFTFLETVQK